MTQETTPNLEELIKKYQEDPQGILDEYNEKHRSQERLARYSAILFGLSSILSFVLGLYLLNWVWNNFEEKFPLVSLILLVVIMTTILTYKFINLSDLAENNTKPIQNIKRIYQQAYLNTLYPNHFEYHNKTADLRSRWAIVRIYAKWKLFNFPKTKNN